MNWLKENLVSIVSILISAGTAIFLGIIVHSQNKKITKLNGKIERGNYVHKIQFEKKFKIYVEIWEKLFKIKVSVYSLTPLFDESTETQDEERQRNEERYQKFSVNYNLFSESLVKHEPFCDEDIYNNLIKIRDIINKDGIFFREIFLRKILTLQHHMFLTQDLDKKEDFENLIHETSKMIKKYINNLIVLE